MRKIAYRRCSTNESKQDVSRQLLGREFDIEYTEYASGKNEDRPVFQKMLANLRQGDSVYFNDLSRCGRNAAALIQTVEKLVAKKVAVIFVTENLTFSGDPKDQMASAMSKMMLTCLSAFNEFFLAQTSVNIKQGLERAKRDGKRIGGASPQWKETFNANKPSHKPNKLRMIDKEKAVPIKGEIERAIIYSSEKLSYQKLVDKLNNVGILTVKGRQWSKGSLSSFCNSWDIKLNQGEI